VAIGPHGDWLATGSKESADVVLWDTATGAELRVLHVEEHPASVLALAVAPAGEWLAAGHADGILRLWDIATGTLRHTMPRLPTSLLRDLQVRATGAVQTAGAVLAAAVTDTVLAAAHRNGNVHLWDVTTGRQQGTLSGSHPAAMAVAVTADGSRVASGHEDGTVHMWDGSGRHLQQIRAHTGPVSGLAFGHDGTWLVTGGEDRTIRVWDTGSGRRITMTRIENAPTAVTSARAEPLIAVAGGTTAYLFRHEPN
jgi:WD40 repeat protein